MCIVAMACSNVDDEINMIDIGNINADTIGSVVNSNDFNKEEIAELITTKALIIDEIFRYIESDDKWNNYTMIPGNTTIHAMTFDGEECTKFHHCPNHDPLNCEGPSEWKYTARYDAETCTLYFQSLYYDYEYSATVIYYDGGKILFHGVLPISDAESTNYPEGNIHRYVGRFSEESAQEWADNLRAELEEEHKNCNKAE